MNVDNTWIVRFGIILCQVDVSFIIVKISDVKPRILYNDEETENFDFC